MRYLSFTFGCMVSVLQVTTALDDLLLHVKTSPKQTKSSQEVYEYEKILNQSRKIITYQVIIFDFTIMLKFEVIL